MRSHLITILGQTLTVTEWSQRYEISRSTVLSRIRRGWNPVKAVVTPAGSLPQGPGWISRKAQMSHASNARRVTIGNETHTVSEWAERYGISKWTVFARIYRGWDPAEAVTTPPGEGPRRSQKRPKRRKLIEAFGRAQTVTEWARETGLSRQVIAYRLRAGWDPEEAMQKRPGVRETPGR